jgi:hypothetical protein
MVWLIHRDGGSVGLEPREAVDLGRDLINAALERDERVVARLDGTPAARAYREMIIRGSDFGAAVDEPPRGLLTATVSRAPGELPSPVMVDSPQGHVETARWLLTELSARDLVISELRTLLDRARAESERLRRQATTPSTPAEVSEAHLTAELSAREKLAAEKRATLNLITADADALVSAVTGLRETKRSWDDLYGGPPLPQKLLSDPLMHDGGQGVRQD